MDIIAKQGLLCSPPRNGSLSAPSEDITCAGFIAFGKNHSYDVSPDSSDEELDTAAVIANRGAPWEGYTITVSGIYGGERVGANLPRRRECGW